MINSVTLENFLSFGGDQKEIELRSLNVIIGTNGSGKSNFLEAFDLLRHIPSDITRPIREGGGVSDWLYKGSVAKDAIMDFIVTNPLSRPKYQELRYCLSFNATGQMFGITGERIESKKPDRGQTKPYIYYDFQNGDPIINVKDESETGYSMRKLQREDVDAAQSIIAQKRDAIHYPEITGLADMFKQIAIYRDWSFGRYTPARLPQKLDLQNAYLAPDCGNLCAVLNRIGLASAQAKRRILEELTAFYVDVEDYEIDIGNSTVQLFFRERGFDPLVPATRLSDGTLRYLCLLAILCHPAPPPLVCIEEPELGLHPDVLPNLATLMKEASERCQLIVTTHSEILVDCFTDDPEAIIVAEKSGGTQLNRLSQEKLRPWLEKYRLGELWNRGDLGGNRY